MGQCKLERKVKHHYNLLEQLKWKGYTIPSFGENMKHLEFSCRMNGGKIPRTLWEAIWQ
jgi:hypothetical protein